MAHLWGMNIGKRARILAAALAIGAVGLSLAPAGQAEARRNDNGVLCAVDHGNGHVDFYLPGESFRVGRIRTTCNDEGEWVSVYVGPRGR